jgi:RNA polymerase sigma-70 factor (ECF subfamily)
VFPDDPEAWGTVGRAASDASASRPEPPSGRCTETPAGRGHPLLEGLLRDFGRRIRQLVESHCRGNPGLDPDDIEQEIRVRLWRALESDRIGTLGASYIQRVVVSTVIDAARRAALRVTESLDAGGHESLAEWTLGPTVEEFAIGRERSERIWGVIESLPVRRRVPIKLHLQGFSLQEIAELEGVTPEAARKLVSRGMEALKERLKQLGIGDDDD